MYWWGVTVSSVRYTPMPNTRALATEAAHSGLISVEVSGLSVEVSGISVEVSGISVEVSGISVEVSEPGSVSRSEEASRSVDVGSSVPESPSINAQPESKLRHRARLRGFNRIDLLVGLLLSIMVVPVLVLLCVGGIFSGKSRTRWRRLWRVGGRAGRR